MVHQAVDMVVGGVITLTELPSMLSVEGLAWNAPSG
jgi:hypothetical protein